MADPQINVLVNPDPVINVAIDADPAPIFTELSDAQINTLLNPDPVIYGAVQPDPAPIFTLLTIAASSLPGPPGDRGNLFLGGYPTFGNLPAIDGVGVRIGDYALVQNTSTMWQVR
jgi:hypothetical protein